MHPTDDSALLRQYAEHLSDEAFAALVTRHINLVYSVALRYVGEPHQAEEVTQAVFILLAKKAGQLRHDKALSSWLFQTTRLTASNFVRSETRRHHREQEAHMQSVLNESGSDLWRQIAPLLDDAVAGLGETDRRAIVLRFYEGRNLREVGAALGASEDAAEKRVHRAVEKLRKIFATRGVTTSSAALAVVLGVNAVQAAPVGLAVTISTAAALGGTTLASAATATAIKTIAMTTLQKTLVTASLAVAAGLGGLGIYEARQASQLRKQNQLLQQQQAPLAEQIQQLQRERDDATNRLAWLAEENATLKQTPTELLKLRGKVGTLRSQLQSATNSVRRTPAAGETANMFNNPTMRKNFTQARLVALRKMHAPLLPEMKLKPEEAEKFFNLLSDNGLKIWDQSCAALRAETTKDAASQTIKDLKNELEGQLQALLGPERYAQYQEFNLKQEESKLNQSVQRTLDSLVKALPDNSLGEDQRQRLLQLLREDQLSTSGSAPLGEMPTSSEEIEQRFQQQAERDRNVQQQAGSFLTAEQLAALASLQAKRISQNRQDVTLMLQMIGASGQGRIATDNQGK